MGWVIGNQPVKREHDFNEEILKIHGELDETTAKITLAKFLRQNIGFTFQLLSGVEMMLTQEVIVRAILKKDNGLVVGSRGVGKSSIAAFLCLLYPLFFFDSKMCLVSTNFRASRRILEQAEKIIYSKKAKLLRQCFENHSNNSRQIIQRAPDMYKIKVGSPANSEVFSLPLTEGLRGTRANFVIIDELLTVPKDMINDILRPFLTSKPDFQQEKEIRKIEDELILHKKITEEDRISFPKNKLCGLSSASYEFQYLYEYYTNIIEQVMNPEDKGPNATSSFCIRISYEALPENSFIDLTQINAARANGGENTDSFKREYLAQFTNSSGSYFNIRKLHDYTVKIGNFPTTQIKGDKNSEYILSIDPSYSSSKETSDFFAMNLSLIDKDERKITVVHSYAKSGGEIKTHFEYLTYLLTYFNIVFIIIDASSTEFIDGYNESSIAMDRNIKLKYIKADFDTDDLHEYTKALQEAKNQHNQESRTIVYAQKFNTANGAIRRMNESMKNNIEAGRVWFASDCRNNDSSFKKYKDTTLPIDITNNQEQILDIGDFISYQDELIKETKAEIALIEVKSTATGVLQYDLPLYMRKASKDNKIRRDLYTCCLMANWAAKIYFNMIFVEATEEVTTMQPIMIF